MSDEPEGDVQEETGAAPAAESPATAGSIPSSDEAPEAVAVEDVAGEDLAAEDVAAEDMAGQDVAAEEAPAAAAADGLPEASSEQEGGPEDAVEAEHPAEPGQSATAKQPRIREIDFSRPTKFSQEHQRRIVRLHETFCRSIGTQLSAELRLPLDFQLISVMQMSWASATAELPAASLFGVMEVLPGTERALIACELPLLQFCLDRMLGGDGLTTGQRSELTEIELALSRGLMDRLAEQLSLVWSESVGTTFQLTHVDTQITNVQLVTPSEAVLGLTVEVKLERGSSTFTVVLPHVAVEPILEHLSIGHFGERQPVDYDPAPVRAALLPIEVELHVDVGSVQLTVDETLRLVPGTVLEFGPIDAGVRLYGGDTATHVCRPGRIGEFRAVEILARTGGRP